MLQFVLLLLFPHKSEFLPFSSVSQNTALLLWFPIGKILASTGVGIFLLKKSQDFPIERTGFSLRNSFNSLNFLCYKNVYFLSELSNRGKFLSHIGIFFIIIIAPTSILSLLLKNVFYIPLTYS